MHTIALNLLGIIRANMSPQEWQNPTKVIHSDENCHSSPESARMKPQKMLITLQLHDETEITRAVISDIHPDELQRVIVQMHDQLMDRKIPTF